MAGENVALGDKVAFVFEDDHVDTLAGKDRLALVVGVPDPQPAKDAVEAQDAVPEERDADGNVTVEAKPAVEAQPAQVEIKAGAANLVVFYDTTDTGTAGGTVNRSNVNYDADGAPGTWHNIGDEPLKTESEPPASDEEIAAKPEEPAIVYGDDGAMRKDPAVQEYEDSVARDAAQNAPAAAPQDAPAPTDPPTTPAPTPTAPGDTISGDANGSFDHDGKPTPTPPAATDDAKDSPSRSSMDSTTTTDGVSIATATPTINTSASPVVADPGAEPVAVAPAAAGTIGTVTFEPDPLASPGHDPFASDTADDLLEKDVEGQTRADEWEELVDKQIAAHQKEESDAKAMVAEEDAEIAELTAEETAHKAEGEKAV